MQSQHGEAGWDHDEAPAEDHAKGDEIDVDEILRRLATIRRGSEGSSVSDNQPASRHDDHLASFRGSHFRLSDEQLCLPVTAINVGMASYILQRKGLSTVKELLSLVSEGFPDVPGFGRRKRDLLAKGITKFVRNCGGAIDRISDDQPDLRSASIHETPGFHTNRLRISETTRDLPLEQVHLHNEIKWLNLIGIHCFGDLVDRIAAGFPHTKGIGRKALNNIHNVTHSAVSSLDENGDVDWEKFASLAGFPIFPTAEASLESGSEFLQSIPHIIDKLTSHSFDPMESAVLSERLIPGSEGATLESLAKSFGVTRKRIRQVQKKLTARLSVALIYGEHADLGFRFSEKFRSFWEAAAGRLGDIETIEFHEFLQEISLAWDVTHDEIIANLPLIYVVLTSEAGVPSDLRIRAKLSPELYQITSPRNLSLSVRHLIPGTQAMKSMRSLENDSIGGLITYVRDSDPKDLQRMLHAVADELLRPLAKAVGPDGTVDWGRYDDLRGITTLPTEESLAKVAFLHSIPNSLERFVSASRHREKFLVLLKSRLIPRPMSRKTIEATSLILNISPHGVMRYEKLLLETLNDAIFLGDYVGGNIRFRPEFRGYWEELRNLCGDFPTHESCRSILHSWYSDDPQICELTAPVVSAILSGRTRGYTGSGRWGESCETPELPATTAIAANDEPKVIQLRGFSRVF